MLSPANEINAALDAFALELEAVKTQLFYIEVLLEAECLIAANAIHRLMAKARAQYAADMALVEAVGAWRLRYVIRGACERVGV